MITRNVIIYAKATLIVAVKSMKLTSYWDFLIQLKPDMELILELLVP